MGGVGYAAMKTLISILFVMMIVGCGKTEPMGSGNEYNAEPVKELTAEEKALRDSVVGEYELKNPSGPAYKLVLLKNGSVEYYTRGKKVYERVRLMWAVENGEIHAGWGQSTPRSGEIGVYRINADKSLTQIALIEDGKRGDYLKEAQLTFKKIK